MKGKIFSKLSHSSSTPPTSPPPQKKGGSHVWQKKRARNLYKTAVFDREASLLRARASRAGCSAGRNQMEPSPRAAAAWPRGFPAAGMRPPPNQGARSPRPRAGLRVGRALQRLRGRCCTPGPLPQKPPKKIEF